ncbi:MAG: MCP four helix bundle domain-containing protein [Bacteroidales bacterium]
MKFKDLKIGTKIMTGLMIVLLIAVVIGVVGILGLRNVASSFHAVSEVRMPSVQYLAGMEVTWKDCSRVTQNCSTIIFRVQKGKKYLQI